MANIAYINNHIKVSSCDHEMSSSGLWVSEICPFEDDTLHIGRLCNSAGALHGEHGQHVQSYVIRPPTANFHTPYPRQY